MIVLQRNEIGSYNFTVKSADLSEVQFSTCVGVDGKYLTAAIYGSIYLEGDAGCSVEVAFSAVTEGAFPKKLFEVLRNNLTIDAASFKVDGMTPEIVEDEGETIDFEDEVNLAYLVLEKLEWEEKVISMFPKPIVTF